jgi:hypothetical protein
LERNITGIQIFNSRLKPGAILEFSLRRADPEKIDDSLYEFSLGMKKSLAYGLALSYTVLKYKMLNLDVFYHTGLMFSGKNLYFNSAGVKIDIALAQWPKS